MKSWKDLAAGLRHRYVGAAAILLTVSAGALILATPEDEPADLRTQIETRMRDTLEQSDPGRHNHAGHDVATAAGADVKPICGVRVYGYEPAQAVALADVRKVYGFHLCGVAEPKRPWDVAVKLAGPVIVDMSTQLPGIQVVEATADVTFADRLREMFPARYADLAQKEALAEAEMAGLRSRYDDAAGL
ncbi:hypothetical protein [Actinoplanes sp. M2I2]|uniref:hypothetical protein n=1 Tax=Actinoplanes sp. M2I2 TaxID=1734444 RepID=UPI00201FB43B|nr:hypothetical protein [Actinoplanes sp. M2I2]